MMIVTNMFVSILVLCCQAAGAMTTLSPPCAPTWPSPEGFVADMPEEAVAFGEPSWSTNEVLVMEWAVSGKHELMDQRRHMAFTAIATDQAE
jgi:hypothetical protein